MANQMNPSSRINPPFLQAAGVPVKIVKHGKTGYRAIAVPKSAVPEAVLNVKEVVMVLSVPQQVTTVMVEARLWRVRQRAVYFITAGPYADWLNYLAEQGIRGLVMYQIAPKGP